MQWKNPLTSTPRIVQTDFGPCGEHMPGDGEAYCCPTAIVMGLYWLYDNGFTQLAPGRYGGQNDPSVLNSERVIAGLAQTSVIGGTSSSGALLSGVAGYLAACGIGHDRYTHDQNYHPDLAWLSIILRRMSQRIRIRSYWGISPSAGSIDGQRIPLSSSTTAAIA